jgi:hypothetical protein
MSPLPIHSVLADLLAALRTAPNAVLVAPPGAGKTTAVAPALLDELWCEGEILLLSPRRLAARAAAERMAEIAGERVGESIGYAPRARGSSSSPKAFSETESRRIRNCGAYRRCCSTRFMSEASTAISASLLRSTPNLPSGPI